VFSLHVVNGDLVADSRGKIVNTQSHQKVSNEIDYAISTSPYILSLVNSFYTNSPQMNEFALRDAIYKTINQLIKNHSNNLQLPSDEKIKFVNTLEIQRLDTTSFKFYLGVTTYAGSLFDLTLEKVL
jgi:hypothetical protein